MKYNYKSFITLAILILSFTTSIAQNNSKPVRILVMDDVVSPSKVMEYEKAQKAMNEFIVKNKMGINWQTYQTDDYTYMYVVPFSTYTSLDSLFKLWDEKMMAVNQDDLKKHFGAFAGTIDQTNSQIVKKNEANSYTPKNPYLKSTEAKFLHWDFFEVIPGREQEAWALMAEYKKLCEKLNLNVPYNAWSVNIGDNTSTIIITTPGKDDVDFYTQNKMSDDKIMKEPGSDALYSKFISLMTKFRHFNGKPRPDLSIGKM